MRLPRLLRPQPPVEDGDGPSSGSLAIDRYDRLEAGAVVPRLRDLSQRELTEIENYERAHADRPEVLNKLRYLRGDEPLPSYDAMSADDVSVAMDDADLATVSKIRAYERRMRRRADVLASIERAHQRLRANHR